MNGVAGFVLVCILWTLVRPYQGLRHDATLYVGQAMHHLRPDIFGRDLFFAHGSQDRFTLVTAPLAWLLSHFALTTVEMAATAASNLAFVAGTWTLAGAIAPARRWICTLSVALMSHAYARLSDFNYGENFFTARSLAEPLVLFALAAWVRRRAARAAVLFALAALAHPLVTIPALAVAWGMRVVEDRRWWWAAALAVPVGALAAMGVAPFAGALQRFDDGWWETLRQFDAQVQLTSWDATDIGSAVLDLMLVGLAAKLLKPPARRLPAALLAASALLLLGAYAFGDLARDVLVVQLQLWRVLWLTHTLAMLCLPIVVLELWHEGEASRVAAAAAAAAVLAVSWTLPHAWLFLAWLPAALVIRHRADGLSAAIVRTALAGTLLAVAGISVVLAVSMVGFIEGDRVLATVALPEVALLSIPTLGLLVGVVLASLLGRLPARGAVLAAIALLALSTTQWDQRSQWIRTVEAGAFGQHPFTRFIPPTAQVYWHLELLPTWVMLDRASFVSDAQASGLVFNRATAQDYVQRSKPMFDVLNQQVACQMAANAAGSGVECQPRQDVVEAFCRAPLAPDFMVFDAHYSRGLVAQWDYQISRGSAPRTAFLYDCAKMR